MWIRNAKWSNPYTKTTCPADGTGIIIFQDESLWFFIDFICENHKIGEKNQRRDGCKGGGYTEVTDVWWSCRSGSYSSCSASRNLHISTLPKRFPLSPTLPVGKEGNQFCRKRTSCFRCSTLYWFQVKQCRQDKHCFEGNAATAECVHVGDFTRGIQAVRCIWREDVLEMTQGAPRASKKKDAASSKTHLFIPHCRKCCSVLDLLF